jgi:hypothetical protein
VVFSRRESASKAKGSKSPSQRIKTEPTDTDSETLHPASTADVSDASRNLPGLSQLMPLKFSARPSVKQEEAPGEAEREEEDVGRTAAIQPLLAEADDEDEDDFDSWRDSGIGTSLDDGARRGMQRRRRSEGLDQPDVM